MQHDRNNQSENQSISEAELRRRVAEISVEGLPPSESVRRWRSPVIFLSIGLLGVSAGAIGFSMSGIYGAGVASVFLLGCLLALSPVLGAAVARKRDELQAVQAS